MWKYRNRKIYLFCIFFLSGCGVFHSTRNENEDFDRLPKNILAIFYQRSSPPFREGALDSLVKFADTLQGFPRFKSRVERIIMERKYVDDFTRAYDGDSAAWARLEKACSSYNLEEADFVVSTLGKMDRSRVIKKLEQLLRWENDGHRVDVFRQMLKRQKYLYGEEHYSPGISIYQKQNDSILNSISNSENRNGLSEDPMLILKQSTGQACI